MYLYTTIKQLGVISYFEKYSDESMNVAKSLALEMVVELFPTKFCVNRKKYFRENNEDEEVESSEYFGVNYFLVVLG